MTDARAPAGVETRLFAAGAVTGDVTAYAEVLDALMQVVQEHGSLYDWAAELPQPRALRGRAPVFVATLPERSDTVVVRHMWHGGFLAPLTGDLFVMPTRAPLELRHSALLRRLGIPTSEVLGFARYHAGPGVRRVDVASRFVPDAYDLGMVAAGLAPQIDREQAWTSTLQLLIAMAAHGVSHADLNVKNILLHRDPQGTLDALVIDLDKVRWDTTRPPMETMRTNVRRLVRSIRKWRAEFGCDVADERLREFERDAVAAAPPRAGSIAVA